MTDGQTGYAKGMPANRRISRVLDEHRFDALVASSAPETPHAAAMLLDRDFRIRGLNATYEAVSMRARKDMLGEFVFDVFPDDPDDPQASGPSQLVESVESALRSKGTDTMPIVRYDITDPQAPDAFLTKLWTCTNTAVDDGEELVGVLHQVAEITSLEAGLSALSRNIADGRAGGPDDQLHVLAALTAQSRAERDSTCAMAREIEQLQRALATRDIIGQAKGMLMERFDVDAAHAFELLVRLSQTSNTPVAEIAHKVVELDHPAS